MNRRDKLYSYKEKAEKREPIISKDFPSPKEKTKLDFRLGCEAELGGVLIRAPNKTAECCPSEVIAEKL